MIALRQMTNYLLKGMVRVEIKKYCMIPSFELSDVFIGLYSLTLTLGVKKEGVHSRNVCAEDLAFNILRGLGSERKKYSNDSRS